MSTKEVISISVALVVFGIAVTILNLMNIILTAETIEIVILFILASATLIYAKRTSEIADATKEQAKEAREQRIMTSRPVIIQKAVVETETELCTFGSRDWFSYFEVYNAGNGPAIEVEISLLNKGKEPIHSQRKSFLRAGEHPIEFCPNELANLEKTIYYLVCEYRGISSLSLKPIWYQTWLPFETVEASENGKIYVQPGELEFKEVTEKNRIDTFGSRSKPK